MADEPIPTPTSDPTPTNPASDPAPVAAEPKADDAPKQDEGDGLGATALGGDGDDPAPKDDAAATVPEAYELTAPEGFEKLDEAAVAAATPVFKELGLSNDQANKLVPVVADYAKRIIADRDQQFMGQIMEQRKTWLTEAKADAEIGGTNWDTSMQDSARALDRLGFTKGSPLRTALNDSGFGNHPEMVRLMARVGKAIGEDTDFVRSDANAAVKPKDDRELFYPNTTKSG